MSKETVLALAIAAAAASAAPAAAQGAIIANNAAYCVHGSYQGASLQTCSSASNQFTRTYDRNRNAWVIKSGNGCLDGYRGHGQPVVVVRCDGTKDQDWWVNPYGQIQNQANNYCLDVAGGHMASGSRVLLWGCHGGANQRFLLKVNEPASVVGSLRLPPVATSLAQQVRIDANGLIGHAGGNIIATGGGNIIATGGGNMVARRGW